MPHFFFFYLVQCLPKEYSQINSENIVVRLILLFSVSVFILVVATAACDEDLSFVFQSRCTLLVYIFYCMLYSHFKNMKQN